MRGPNREFWSQLLAQLNDPSVGVVAKALADAHNLEVGTACDSVGDAIDGGILVEEDTGGAFDVVRPPEEDDLDNEPTSRWAVGRQTDAHAAVVSIGVFDE